METSTSSRVRADSWRRQSVQPAHADQCLKAIPKPGSAYVWQWLRLRERWRQVKAVFGLLSFFLYFPFSFNFFFSKMICSVNIYTREQSILTESLMDLWCELIYFLIAYLFEGRPTAVQLSLCNMW